MNSPIDTETARSMIVVAIIFDLISIIPFADMIMDVCATLIFGMWFSHHNVSLMKKRPLGFLGTILGEFIPIVSALPFWTYFVWSTIRKERRENGL